MGHQVWDALNVALHKLSAGEVSLDSAVVDDVDAGEFAIAARGPRAHRLRRVLLASGLHEEIQLEVLEVEEEVAWLLTTSTDVPGSIRFQAVCRDYAVALALASQLSEPREDAEPGWTVAVTRVPLR